MDYSKLSDGDILQALSESHEAIASIAPLNRWLGAVVTGRQLGLGLPPSIRRLVVISTKV
jgi:hypothetical protein